MLVNNLVRRSRSIGKVGTAFKKFSAPASVAAFQEERWSDRKRFTAAGIASLAVVLCIGLSSANGTREPKKDTSSKKWKVISRKEVEFHNCVDRDIWVTYKNGVYDITDFIYNHPGGKDHLMGAAGQDIGDAWNLFQNHKQSSLALKLLESMKIGELAANEVIEAPPAPYAAEFSTEPVYDVIIVGAGLSGLQCGHALVNQYGVAKEGILVLEAQDYIGGRVKQITEFVKGAKIEVGAEFLHGNNTELTKFAKATDEPLREIYCWAHGDGGPLPETADSGYGLYYVGANKKNSAPVLQNAGDISNLPYTQTATDVALNSKDRLLRYDATDPDFVALNKALWELCDLHEDQFDESLSLHDYLIGKQLNPNMLKMAAAGFSNTLCSNSHELSLKQAVKWSRLWHAEGEDDEEDGDYTFKNSYSSLVDHLKKDLQVEINTPVTSIVYPDSFQQLTEEGLVTITTKNGAVYRAKKIVITASPHVINNKMIDFTPALPPAVLEAYDSTLMNNITKVIMKFSKPVWPKDLHGMIMVDDDFLLPEVWFRIVPDEVASDERATCYAVGFTTAKYAERVANMTQDEVLSASVAQLEKVFSKLEQQHMSGDSPDSAPKPSSLPRASEAYLGGMFWDWQPAHHPYIGGGYCSPRANKTTRGGDVLSKAYAGNRMFFAGEATNDRPGATAHAALETGLRAARLVSSALLLTQPEAAMEAPAAVVPAPESEPVALDGAVSSKAEHCATKCAHKCEKKAECAHKCEKKTECAHKCEHKHQ